jgi:hypothetical protein
MFRLRDLTSVHYDPRSRIFVEIEGRELLLDAEKGCKLESSFQMHSLFHSISAPSQVGMLKLSSGATPFYRSVFVTTGFLQCKPSEAVLKVVRNL